MVEILTLPSAVLVQTAAAPGTALSPGLEFLTHPTATFFPNAPLPPALTCAAP